MFLPKLDNRTDLEHPAVIEAVDAFRGLLSLNKSNDVSHIAIGLSSLIVMYEVRLRANPSCLDPEKYSLLARNLFLNMRVLYQMGSCVDSFGVSPFQHFVIELIKCETPDASVGEIARKYTSKLKGEKLFLFLRRVRLTEYFALGIEHQRYIDWNAVLTNEKLCARFKCEFDGSEYELEPFRLTQLPHNYLHLGKEPFGFCEQISSSDARYYMSLYDGRLLAQHEIKGYVGGSKENFVLVMNLNVRHSQVNVILKNTFPRIYRIPSVYLDFLGNEGVGFQNGFELFLSEERYQQLADDFLSGEILKYVTNNC